MVAALGDGAGADWDWLGGLDDGAEFPATGGGACEWAAPDCGGPHGGCSGRGARVAGHGMERGSWRSAGGALPGDAWFAGAAAAGLVDRSPPFRSSRADSAGSHLCGGCQLSGAFRADLVAGFSGAIDCAT